MGEKTIARNRKAHHSFDIEETLEAGLVLTGSEIKSIRAGNVDISEAYAMVESGEAWLMNAYISPYEQASLDGHEPRRPRKLLLHRREIDDLGFRTQAKGYALVALRLYLRDGLAKVELALAKGRKAHDKRRAIRERETERDLRRYIGRR